ncbi:MAG: carboxypeptidase M32 [Planctomycetota bacterium]|nr:carboxypeptidase M32 [Planctomycetota bacterium]
MATGTLNSNATVPAHYAELCRQARRAATLGSIGSLVSWDQETYMPPAAGEFRAEQLAELAELAHKAATDPRRGELIAACEGDAGLMGDPTSEAARNVREFRRDYTLATKLPTDLVSEMARTCSQAQEVWKEARAKSDFAMFRPLLEKIFGLARRKAECYGWPKNGEPYDALLDEYEPGATSAEVHAVFVPLRERLSALIARVSGKPRPSDAVLHIKAPADRQHALGLDVLRAMGFDLEAGRLDTTTHPFCSGMAPGDTRLTTRYRDEKFTDALYGTMHEAGHGLYEQGLPKRERFGQPLGDAVSLGIHESQSRLWENFVGRSPAFWRWAWPLARKHFGAALDGFGEAEIVKAVNLVTPSYIRVEADEATYNLHIMLRFELERAMLRGDLKIADLAGEWRTRFKQYLGIEVPDDRRGCLQDVHWSAGLIGYFPTYTLGNLYAAQLWETISRQMATIEADISAGKFIPLRDWLRSAIHVHGRRYQAAELCHRATGAALSADPLMRHLEGRAAMVYGL